MNNWQKNLLGMLTGGTSVVIKTLINIFLVPLIIARLGLESFSIYVMLISVYELSTLLDLGATSALITLLGAQKKQSNERNAILQSGHLWFLLLSVLFLAAGLLLGNAFTTLFHIQPTLLPLAMSGLHWVILESVVTLYGYYYEAILLTNLSQQWSNVAETVYHLVANLGSFLALILGMGLDTVFLIRFVAACIRIVFVMANSIRIEPACSRLPVSPMAIKKLTLPLTQMGKLSSHALMINFSIIVSHKIDSFVIASFLPMSAVGIYEIVFRFLGIAVQICLKLNAGLYPLFAELASSQNKEKAAQLFLRMSSLLYCIAAAIITVVVLHYHDLFALFSANKVPVEPTIPILIVAVPTLLSGILQMPANAWLFTWGYQKHLTITSVIAAIANLTLSLLLVKPLGILGVALGTLVPQLVQHQLGQIRTTCLHLNISLQNYLKQVHVAIILPILTCIVWTAVWHPLIQQAQSTKLLYIGLVSMTGVLSSLSLWFWLTASPEENSQLKQLVFRKIKKPA
jgi:O-antigen/teichoic acid export membrane protein